MPEGLRVFFKKISFRPLVVSLIVIYALYLRFQVLAGRDLWNDEVFQLRHTVGAFKPFWQRFSYGDMTCFPGDYLLTYPFVVVFNDNKWGMAIPHMLATALGFYFLYKICQKYYRTIWGFVVAFLIVSFNQHLIFHSFELRPYAVLPTLALLSMYFADMLVNRFEELGQGKKAAIGALFVGMIWFHALGILIVFFPLLYFLLVKKGETKGGKTVGDILKFLSIVFLIAMPVWAWYALGNPLGESKAVFQAKGVHSFSFMMNPLDNFGTFYNYIISYHLIGYKRFYFLLGAFALIVFVPYGEKMKKIGFFLVMIVLPIMTILVASLFQGYWFLMRHYVYTMPLFAFFLGWLWDSSLHYYLEKPEKRFSFPTVIGFALMVICAAMGTGSIVLHALNLI